MSRGKRNTIPLPENWKSDFRKATMKTNFVLGLSQPMIEMLSAVADGVQWDRRDMHTIHSPDNPFASVGALEKRGLIVLRSEADREKRFKALRLGHIDDYSQWNTYKLTPAGSAVVNLLKVTGIFVESDAAIRKKARG